MYYSVLEYWYGENALPLAGESSILAGALAGVWFCCLIVSVCRALRLRFFYTDYAGFIKFIDNRCGGYKRICD